MSPRSTSLLALGAELKLRFKATLANTFPARRGRGFIFGMATNIQRPTVLSWAFSFADSARHAGLWAILRVPTAPGMGDITHPVCPCSALSSLETCANFFAVAHAGGLVCQ